jgi:hypothetical protein
MPRSANNSSCGSYIAPILLALRRLHGFSLIDPEIAYKLDSTDRKRKYGKSKMKSK